MKVHENCIQSLMQVTSSDLPLESKEKEKSHDDNHLKWLGSGPYSNPTGTLISKKR